MQSLYSREVAEYLNSRAWPKGLVMEVHEQEEPAPHLLLVFFRDNFNSFTGDERAYIASVVFEALTKLRGDGVPIYMAPPMKSVNREIKDDE